jgi:hypothetical protein
MPARHALDHLPIDAGNIPAPGASSGSQHQPDTKETTMQTAATTTTKPTAAKSARRLAATVAIIAAVGAASAGPAAASASAAGCPSWMCGTTGNHNEIMATSTAR